MDHHLRANRLRRRHPSRAHRGAHPWHPAAMAPHRLQLWRCRMCPIIDLQAVNHGARKIKTPHPSKLTSCGRRLIPCGTSDRPHAIGRTERPLRNLCPMRNLCFGPSILPSVKNQRFYSAWSAVLLAIAMARPVAPFAHGQTAQPDARPQLAIIDTDIGDDIDDAFAVALALRSPELHILGVTTTYGDTELRARLLDRYLGSIGRADIPVAAGVATPQNNVFTQAAYAHHAPERKHPDAVAFLLNQIRAH